MRAPSATLATDLLGGFVFLTVLTALVVAMAVIAWRRVSAKVSRAREHPLTQTAIGAYQLARNRPPPPWAPTYKLHRSVIRATRSVELARSAGAPLGELPGILNELTASATVLERAYQLNPARTASGADYQHQLKALIDTASHVHSAALSALQATTRSGVTELSQRASQEHVALDAGLVHLSSQD